METWIVLGDEKSSQQQSLEELFAIELDANVEVAKFAILGGDFIPAHLIDDGFDLEDVVSKEGDTPLVAVQTGGAGDELAYLARKFAAGFGVTTHEFTAFVEFLGIPVGTDVAALAHGVKAHDLPVGHVRVKAVIEILIHVALPLGDAGGVGFRADFQIFRAGDAGGGVFFLFAVFGPLGHGEVAVGRIEDLRAEGLAELLFKAVRILEVGCEEHDAEICLGADHAKGEQLRLGMCPDGLNGGIESIKAFGLFFRGEGGPEAVIHVIKKVLNDPAFLRDDGGHGDLAGCLKAALWQSERVESRSGTSLHTLECLLLNGQAQGNAKSD